MTAKLAASRSAVEFGQDVHRAAGCSVRLAACTGPPDSRRGALGAEMPRCRVRASMQPVGGPGPCHFFELCSNLSSLASAATRCEARSIWQIAVGSWAVTASISISVGPRTPEKG